MIIKAKDKKTAFLTAVFFSVSGLFLGPSAAQTLTAMDHEIAGIVNRVSRGVVTVEARWPEGRMPLFPNPDINRADPVRAVVGSGLLIDSLGHVLTLLNLVEGREEFRIFFDHSVADARLVGIDRRYNLAVIKIDSVFSDYLKLSPVPPLIGRLAIAFGRAAERTGYPALGVIAGRRNDGSYLMSASILPGLLGGGVFDLSGRLIGLIASGSVAAAGPDAQTSWNGLILIPAETALTAADRIICCGNHEAGYLGVKTTDIEMVSADGRVMGEAVAVTHVDPGSPADLAGLRSGDIITHFASREVGSDRELQRMILTTGSSTPVEVEYIRGEQDNVAVIRLAGLSRRFESAGRPVDGAPKGPRPMMPQQIQRRIDSLQQELVRISRELDLLWQSAGASR